MVKFRGDAKSWRSDGLLFTLFGIPPARDREEHPPSSSTRESRPNDNNTVVVERYRQDKQGLRRVLRVESSFYDPDDDTDSIQPEEEEEVNIRHTSSKNIPAKKRPTSEEILGTSYEMTEVTSSKAKANYLQAESDTNEDSSQPEEASKKRTQSKKHVQSKKRSSTKQVVSTRQTPDSDTDESPEAEVVAPVKKQKKAVKDCSSSSSNSDTLVESDTVEESSDSLESSESSEDDSDSTEELSSDDESSESEEEVIPQRTRNKTPTYAKGPAPGKKAREAVKSISSSESRPSSTENESDADAEDSSSEEEVVAKPTQNKKAANKKIAKPAPPSESEDNSSEDEPEEVSDAKEESSHEEVIVTKKQAPARKPIKAVAPPPESSSDSSDSSEVDSDTEKDNSHSDATAIKAQPQQSSEDIRMERYRDSEWGIHEDGMICYMKSEGCYSQLIAEKIKRGKKEVQARIQEITELAEEGGTTIQHLGKVFGDYIKSEIKKDKEARKINPQSKPRPNYQAESRGKGNAKEPSQMPAAEAKPRHNKPIESRAKPDSSSSPTPSTSGATTSTSPPASVSKEDRIDVLRTPPRAFPNRKVFYPDGTFNVHDCHALAVAEARFRDQNCRRIQAEFYNLTGKYLDINVLEAKLAQATEPYDKVTTNWGGICRR
ncbi:hypothetical protein Daesc_004650 [Daldinia eschscholtzii]|uniref:Uncharacterized protein n=1 Tax=Daldinia eschscholtzii TaxID=292717 RepID=A0AAX6MR82_9PEZI